MLPAKGRLVVTGVGVRAGKLVSRGIADVKSRTQTTQGVAAASRPAAAAPLRHFRTVLWALALATVTSAAAVAQESVAEEVTASIDATVQGVAGTAIEVHEAPAAAPAVVLPAAAAIPASPVAEAPSTSPSTPAAVAESVKPLDLSPYAPGTIVVQTSQRKLHLVLGGGEVVSYPVGVGKAGKAWSGTAYIRGKYIAPPWSPPKAVKREKPHLPDYIPGGVPSNPMGAAAMTLSVDQYAIHGTNVPSSIGTFASFGCIRMHNRDVLDLYKRVRVGTKVVVLN